MSSLLLISLDSFAKAPNTIDYNRNSAVEIFKIDNTISSMKPVVERNRLWLNLTNAGGAFKQILVGYMTGATNGWDKFYDTVTLDSNPYVDFYSINGGKNLTIQGRALPFDVADEVPLGYKTTISGEFNITINNFDGFFVTQDIFLLDTTTGLIHNLKNGTYSFETAVGVFNDRFVLLYVDSTPLAQSIAEEPVVVEDIVVAEEIVGAPIIESVEIQPTITEGVLNIAEVAEPIIIEQEIDNDQNTLISSSTNNKKNSVVVTVKNNQITIYSVDEAIKEISVYNMNQIKLFQKDNVNTNEFVMPELTNGTQFLIIKTKLKKGNWLSNKIIL